jgi:hypothetical protein
MHIIQAIQKAFEDGEKYYTARDDFGNMYEVYKSIGNDGESIRIIKNGMMIEIPFEIKFKKPFESKFKRKD